jgi:hypothetical protein
VNIFTLPGSLLVKTSLFRLRVFVKTSCSMEDLSWSAHQGGMRAFRSCDTSLRMEGGIPVPRSIHSTEVLKGTFSAREVGWQHSELPQITGRLFKAE